MIFREDFLIKDYVKFKDRDEALGRLIDLMPSQMLKKPDSILIAISDGGLYIAFEIAKRFNLNLNFLFTEPIYAPKNSECEVAIVSESMDIEMNESLIDSFGISYDFIYGEAKRRYDEKILPKIYKFRKGEIISSLNKKNVFLIDDGIDTGLTMSVAIKTCAKKLANTITIITPVVCNEVANILEAQSDGLYCVYRPEHFVGTKNYYENLPDLENAEMLELLDKSLNKKKVEHGN